MPIEVMVGDKVKSLSEAFQKHIEQQCREKDGQKKEAIPVGPKVTVSGAIMRNRERRSHVQSRCCGRGERAIGKGEENLNPWGKIEMGGLWTKGKIALTHPVASMVMTSKRDIRGVLKVKTDGMPAALEETDRLVAKSKDNPNEKGWSVAAESSRSLRLVAKSKGDPKGKRSVERDGHEKRAGYLLDFRASCHRHAGPFGC